MMLLALAASVMIHMVSATMPPPSPPPPTRRRTTTLPPPPPPPSTLEPGACMYNGRTYRDGEEIDRDRDNCYGSYCESGDVLHWDAACFFGTSPCNGEQVRVPGQCCPDCIERTTTPERTTTVTPPLGCFVNETFYEIGSAIPQTNPCKWCTCTKENGVMCTMASCGPVRCVNPRKKKTECCPTCPDGPNCRYGMRKIKVGEIYRPRPNIQCSCPEPYEPLAVCRKLPGSKKFLRRQLRRQSWYMHSMYKAYIEEYLGI